MALTKQQSDFIKMVANRLAKNYMKPLFDLTKEKSYSAHIGGLAEILDWSKEFYDKYYDKIVNRQMVKYTAGNIYDDAILDNLIDSFGSERLKKFNSENESNTNYFIEKYSAIL